MANVASFKLAQECEEMFGPTRSSLVFCLVIQTWINIDGKFSHG